MNTLINERDDTVNFDDTDQQKDDTLRTKMYRKPGPFQSCEVTDDKMWDKCEYSGDMCNVHR